MSTTPDPLAAASAWVTDGGLETDLIFNRGIDLPEFASFPLVESEQGSRTLESYYADYVAIAAAAEAGVLLETPTWRANPDWGAQLGFDGPALDRINRRSVDLVRGITRKSGVPAVVSGAIGPRGDGYVAGDADADGAAAYHGGQVRAFAAAGADLVHAMTMTTTAEAIGIVQAARTAGVPVAISFTVETDGRLPDGTALAEAVAAVEAAAPADWYGVNCAHPTHLAPALDGGAWQQRLSFLRPNASTLSHEELDAAEELDAGDLDLLTRTAREVRDQVSSVRVIGGCCGTDSRHVAALWGVDPGVSV